jgi:FKBP-type peptidyl-prolyl cis-trans isomerase SlyD
MMLPSFEENLEQKVAGDTFSFVLEPQNAYGYFEDEAVVDIPISSFQDEDGNVDRSKLTVGSPINMMDNNNNSYQGTVQESKEESIVIDFNHPMAGYTLHFKGEVLEVREATDSEMDHGHIHE